MNFQRFSMMLLCSDVPAARDFYVQHLALEVNADIGWFVGLQRPGRPREAFELSLCEKGHVSVPETLRRGPTEGLVLAFEVESVDGVFEQLQAAGVCILAEPVDEPWGQRHFFAAAPDGVALDVFQSCAADAEWMKQNGFA